MIPRSRSSGALSIWSYAMNDASPCAAATLVIAAVSVVFPWSTCPMVPTFTCGLLRSNFSLPMVRALLPCDRWSCFGYLPAAMVPLALLTMVSAMLFGTWA